MIPEFLVKTGTFARPTAAGPQAITGIGFEPKVVLLFAGNRASVGDSVDVRYSFGGGSWEDFSQATGMLCLSTDDPNFTDKGIDGTSIYQVFRNLGGSVELEGWAQLTSTESDGFTLEWFGVDANAPLITYVVMGGAAITHAHAGTYTLPSTVSSLVVDCGFQPDVVFMFVLNAANGGATQELCYGSSWGTTEGAGLRSAFVTVAADDGSAPTNTHRMQRTNTVYSIINPNTGGVVRLGSSFGPAASGFKITHSPVRADFDSMGYVAIQGLSGYINSLNQPTATGDQSVTGSGFTPKLMLTQQFCRAGIISVQPHMRLGHGLSDGTNQRTWFQGSSDNVNPPVNREDYNESTVIRNLDETGSGVTILSQASFVSFDSNGATINWGTVDATVRPSQFLLLAAKPIYLGHFLPQVLGQWHAAAKLWTFDADEEGWTAVSGSWGATKGRNGTGGWGNECTSLGKGCTTLCIIEWAGTFEDLGVPAGATVEYVVNATSAGVTTGIDAYANGNGDSDIVTYELQDEFGVQIQPIITSQDITTSYRRWYGPDEASLGAPLNLASNTSIRLQAWVRGRVASGTIGIGQAYIDNVGVVVRYKH